MSKPPPQQVTVKVPATMANMGAGFDCIGMAVDLWKTVTISRGEFAVEVYGEGAREIPLDARNLMVTGAEAAFAEANMRLPSLKYISHDDIPVGRGLGSSSAAIVGGLFAGAVLAGVDIDQERLVSIAADIEGHPDNVAPAIFGGCVVGVRNGNSWTVGKIPVPAELKCVLYIPKNPVYTHESRARLPATVSMGDAVFNIGRASLLTTAFATGNLDLLKEAVKDKLHQPYRASGFPAMKRLMEAAFNGGAKGAFLSGSGPVVAALTAGREVTVAYEMAEMARIVGVAGVPRITVPALTGVHIAETT